MKYRKHKDFVVSEVGIGCYGLSGAYGSKDIEEYTRMLRRAFEMGVNFFDTAGTYGEAEQVLGEVFVPFRQHVYIATKVGVKGGIKPDLSASYVRFACNQSLERLQTDYIDLYQVQFEDPLTPVEETIGELEGLVKAGKIRRYGVGHLPAASVETYLQYGHIFSVQMELSAAERYARRRILKLCEKHGIAGIAFSVTGRGLLTGQITHDMTFEPGDIRNIDPLFQRNRFESGLRVAERLAQAGKRYGKTPAQAAIAWALAQPGILCAITGPSTIEHMEENVGGSGWRFSERDLDAFEEFLQQEDTWLEQEEKSAVWQILGQEISKDPRLAFADLVYAIETCVMMEMVAESEIIPLLVELYSAEKDLEPDSGHRLESIRSRMSELIQIRSR